MEMSPQLARLVAWLEEMHARVMQAEQAALAVMGDMPAYTARMQEKARLLASLEEEGEAYLEELPEQLQDQAGHRLHPAPAGLADDFFRGQEGFGARAQGPFPVPSFPQRVWPGRT